MIDKTGLDAKALAHLDATRAERASMHARTATTLTGLGVGAAVTPQTAERILDALCGLAGHERTLDPAERARVAGDAIREHLASQVATWERLQAQRSISAVEPVDLG